MLPIWAQKRNSSDMFWYIYIPVSFGEGILTYRTSEYYIYIIGSLSIYTGYVYIYIYRDYIHTHTHIYMFILVSLLPDYPGIAVDIPRYLLQTMAVSSGRFQASRRWSSTRLYEHLPGVWRRSSRRKRHSSRTWVLLRQKQQRQSSWYMMVHEHRNAWSI